VLADEIRAWRTRLESTLADWSARPDSLAAEALREHLSQWRAELEARIESLGVGDGAPTLDDDDWRRFYALLGGYRGVSGTLLAYGNEARQIDWVAWQEERFS